MSVLDGPRDEWRRVLHEGVAQWVRPAGDELVLGDGRRIAEAGAAYLAPCDPAKILCVHLNYQSRLDEFENPGIETPTYFQKPTTALNAHRGSLARPAGTKYLNYEGEIAAIVGRPMRNSRRPRCGTRSPVSRRRTTSASTTSATPTPGSMLRVKGMDGFCPIGPGIVRGVDVRDTALRTYVNGAVVQEAPVSEMTFGIDYLLADLCRYITLLPGDVVLTGTPANSRPLQPGDVVEVEVDGIGRLTNTVVDAPAPAHLVGHQPTDSKQVRAVALGSDYRRLRDEARARET